jgi:hypothetical protein
MSAYMKEFAIGAITAIILAGALMAALVFIPLGNGSSSAQDTTTVMGAPTSLPTIYTSIAGDTTAAPCNSPGTFCGPGFSIVNASLASASTVGGNTSVLIITLQNTYPSEKVGEFMFVLSNKTVGEHEPNWGAKEQIKYVLNIPTTLLNVTADTAYTLQVQGYFFTGPLKGNAWISEVLPAQ